MQAVQLDASTGQLQLRVVDVPRARGEDVLVQVAFSGVCGTDLHAMQGGFPCRQTGPLTLGHEFCGVVRAVGDQVRVVKVGDRVAVNPKRGCDRCGLCQDGRYQFCEVDAAAHSVGMWRDGGWAELCLVPEKNLHRLPAGMSLRQASLMEPLSCVVHGWELAAPLPVGSRVLVLGAGVIGNLWAALLHHHGHRQVTVSEPLEGRRRALHKLGTGYEVVSPAELRAKPAGWTVDLVVDCSGHAPAVQHALGLLGPGGTLLLFGVAPPRAVISISPYDMYKNELKIKAVNRNPFTCNKALGLIEAMGDRYIDFEKLGVKTFRLTEYKSAIEELAKGSISKAMFEVDAEFPKGA
ncbi:D-altritol 5-dehydrogenase-like isoform X1 [Bacillus rossius redtenbacheri]|uniref:D-altritol 5-dehydrogenase-like isoform X1 n=1 Tax=Bacillus rossius redtenbacheri TaxID=93214 RepID=UPI002FDE2A27